MHDHADAAELLAGLRSGDSAAVERLHDAYAGAVLALAQLRPGRKVAAERAGDAFIGVLRAVPAYAGAPDEFPGWFFAQVRRVLAAAAGGAAGPAGTDQLEVRVLLEVAAVTPQHAATATGRTVGDVTALAESTPDDVAGLAKLPEDLRARQLARLAAVTAGGEIPAPRLRRPRLRVALAGAVIGALLAGGVGVAAASTAVPGQPLYSLKTAREHLQISLARSGDSRATLHVKFAQTRLDEAAVLLRHNEPDRALATLARADAGLAKARAQGSADVDSRAESERARRVAVLTGLLRRGLPAPAADAARDAIERARRP